MTLAGELAAIVGQDWVVTDRAQAATYACDGLTGYRVVPSAVVLPDSTAEVAAVVRVLHGRRVPFVARGAGTGISGGALPVADGVVIALTRMRRILHVDLANDAVTVEPGVRNVEVSEAVAAAGRFFAPDPSSQLVSTIGGNLAENSGGAHCLKYGFTTHHVRAATLVLPDGRIARIGAAAADAPGLDLLAAVVGSEGTLGVVTEVTVGVVPVPEAVETLLAAFPSTEAAGEAVTRIIAAGVVPAAMEFLDRYTIDCVREHMGIDYPDCDAVLIVELDGPAHECRSLVPRVEEIARACGAVELRLARDDAERAELWRGRKKAFAAMATGYRSFYVQDSVVPRTRLAAVLRAIQGLEEETGIRIGNVFHAGDGNIHPLILFDAGDADEARRAEEVAGRILDICLELGGSITGEHGVGHDKVCHMPRQFNGGDLTVMDRLRAAFDPTRVANPGKLLPTPRLCGEVPGFHRVHPLEQAGLADRF